MSITLNLDPQFHIDTAVATHVTAHDDETDTLIGTVYFEFSDENLRVKLDFAPNIPFLVQTAVANEAATMLDSFFDDEAEGSYTSVTIGL